MATITKNRLIYTSGTFLLTDALRTCRRITVFVDVLRKPPSAVYQNERVNPPKNFFGYVSIWSGEYVSKVIPLEYESQIVLEYDNLEFQLYKTINCVGALVIDGLVALGSAMTPPAILLPVTPTPADFPGCRYEWLKFKLEPLTRISVTAFGEEAIGCDDVTFPTTLPELPDEIPPYPDDRPLAEDPPRADPEEGELPGDSTPASAADPDLGYGVTGVWIITYSLSSGGVAEYPPITGLNSDTFAIEIPGVGCTLAGSSQLVRNGIEIIDDAFNCNTTGYISTIVEAEFVPD